ncbi:MAG: hypothetical protein JSS49_25405 [Planctomycetes bacterium]|nr:hypothetical protein [Planctomycetota bacterium]
MPQTTTSVFDPPALASVPHSAEFEDQSPFGLQGLARQTLKIVKPNCIARLAITLALRGTSRQIRDLEFVSRELSFHPDWVDEYQVVHLIERSLWIQGQSDLVMTLIKNPTQIPDNPPLKIRQALARAYALHPQATIWYGVPLFGDETTSDGLPIPVTAPQVRAESLRRIRAAQQHALRWGWLYRAALGTARFPARCWRFAGRVWGGIQHAAGCVVQYWNRAREDSRRRTRAAIKARLEYLKMGYSQTEIPEHRTWLGHSLDAAGLALELMMYQSAIVGYAAPYVGAAAAPLAIAHFAPLLFVPLTIVATDPFLFVELPDEPGKLRHLGHWYWQTESRGRQKLHMHV